MVVGRWRFAFLGLFLVLSACTSSSPTHPPLAPADVYVWTHFKDLPQTLREELDGRYIPYVAERVDMQLYDNLFVHFSNTPRVGPFFQPMPVWLKPYTGRFSRDGQYYAYTTMMVQPEVGLIDIKNQTQRILLRRKDLADIAGFEAVAFGPNSHYLVVVVGGDNFLDLMHINLIDGSFRRLYTNAPLVPWTSLDIAFDGTMVAQCSDVSPTGSLQLYLCLLNSEGKSWRRLTSSVEFPQEELGTALFTPDGAWVVYSKNYRLYKVSRQGDPPIALDSCTVNGPVWVTTTHALTPCYTRYTPKCYALYAVALDGSGLYRLGFIPEICPTVRATQESQH